MTRFARRGRSVVVSAALLSSVFVVAIPTSGAAVVANRSPSASTPHKIALGLQCLRALVLLGSTRQGRTADVFAYRAASRTL
jgi:hypothetical protein